VFACDPFDRNGPKGADFMRPRWQNTLTRKHRTAVAATGQREAKHTQNWAHDYISFLGKSLTNITPTFVNFVHCKILIVVFPCILKITQLSFQQNAHVFYY
jgi:hypothetical protein